MDQYSNPSSEVYAPMLKTGAFSKDSQQDTYQVHSPLLSTLDGLLELEASLPLHMTQPRVSLGRKSSPRTAGAVRSAKHQARLEQLDKTIQLTKTMPKEVCMGTLLTFVGCLCLVFMGGAHGVHLWVAATVPSPLWSGANSWS